jgi:hypothetical protein
MVGAGRYNEMDIDFSGGSSESNSDDGRVKINEDFEDVSNSDNEETKVIPSTIIYRKLSKEINLQSKNKVIYNLF